MKICILAEYLTYVGGGERVYCNLANVFADNMGYDVTIATFESGDKTFYPLSRKVKIKSLSLRKEKYYSSPFQRKLLMLCCALNDIKCVEKYLLASNFDVVLGIATNISLLLSLIRCKCIKIGTEHTEYFGTATYLRLIRKKLYPRLDYLTVLTEADRALFSCFMHEKVFVMHNPLSVCCDVNTAKLSVHKLISIGSLSPQKDHETMLRIFCDIAIKYPDWVLEIYGVGPLKLKIENQIREMGLSDRVILCGVATDVRAVLLDSSIFILTSKIEGFGLVLIEAMSCGVPCVSFDNSGPAAIVDDGITGFLINNRNVNDFVDKISALIDSPSQRRKMGGLAKESVRRYDISQIEKNWQSFFYYILKL